MEEFDPATYMRFSLMDAKQQEKYLDLDSELVMNFLRADPEDHQKSLVLKTLVQLPEEAVAQFRSRLNELSVERFCALVELLKHVSNQSLIYSIEQLVLLPLPAPDAEMQRQSNEHGNSNAKLDNVIDSDLHDTPREDHFSTYNDLIIQPPYLPPEIITMILDKYYEAVFIPGEIQPDELVSEDGDYFAATTYFHRHLKAIARLNPKMYDEYKHRYWKENTLVPRKGGYDDLENAMEKLPTDQKSKIRSVQINCTIKDLDPLGYSLETFRKGAKDLLDSCRGIVPYAVFSESDLISTWALKSFLFAKLELEHIVLDLSEAYSPTGEYLGRKFAKTARICRFPAPCCTEIIAPNPDWVEPLRDIMRRAMKNS